MEKTNRANQQRKPRLLLNWDTTRKDLMEPFLQFGEDFEVTVVWGDPSEKERLSHPFRQIRFVDYATPYQLLNDVKPDSILFFNVNNFPQVALNMAARNRGIPTFTMHHGIHHADFLEINRKKVESGGHRGNRLISNLSSFRFYFSAIRLRNLGQLFPMIRFAWYRQRMERTLACAKCVFPARLPDKYIDLSPHNAIIAKKIDRLTNDDRFIYIGHPFFDRILSELNDLKKAALPSPEAPYWLLVDFPNNENVLPFRLMTADGKKDFYRRLSALAKASGCRLKIKLHPFGYDSPHNYQDENIDLIREADMASLIHYADKCFSFFSTLIIPIIYYKESCFLFHIGDDRELQNDLEELGVAIRLEASGFTAEDVVVRRGSIKENAYETFLNHYLFFTDGMATTRLKKILSNA